MLEDAPAQAQGIMKGLKKPAGAPQQSRRDYSKAIQSVSTFERTREKQNIRGRILCDRAEFFAHWKGRGRKKAKVKKMWAKATSGKKFRKKLAFKKPRIDKNGKKKI